MITSLKTYPRSRLISVLACLAVVLTLAFQYSSHGGCIVWIPGLDQCSTQDKFTIWPWFLLLAADPFLRIFYQNLFHRTQPPRYFPALSTRGFTVTYSISGWTVTKSYSGFRTSYYPWEEVVNNDSEGSTSRAKGIYCILTLHSSDTRIINSISKHFDCTDPKQDHAILYKQLTFEQIEPFITLIDDEFSKA